MEFEIKVFISYLVICLTYSLCRLHYLLNVKSDDEFNELLGQLKDLSGDKDAVRGLVIMQIILSPITAPFSILKQIYKLIRNLLPKT